MRRSTVSVPVAVADDAPVRVDGPHMSVCGGRLTFRHFLGGLLYLLLRTLHRPPPVNTRVTFLGPTFVTAPPLTCSLHYCCLSYQKLLKINISVLLAIRNSLKYAPTMSFTLFH
ncbi:hypothetical protein J6590_057727 [Homalodisca vitripennis]|nr:hypothetical protein J6590_057727 [Homalodisca vitripennis]